MMTTMNRQQLWQLWQLLCDKGLAEGTLPPTGEIPSPWYVRLMLGVAGWIGALFLLGFVGAAFAFVLKSTVAACVLGLLCCAGAYFIFKRKPDSDFMAQFGLAFSLAGQGMVVAGLFAAFKHDSVMLYFGAFVLEAGLALLLPNFIHRVLTGWGAMLALSLTLGRIGMPGLPSALAAAACAAIWLREIQSAGLNAASRTRWQPLGYAMALSLVMLDVSLLLGHGTWWPHASAPSWLTQHALPISAAMVAVVFLSSVMQLLRHAGIAPGSRAGVAALGSALLVAALSFPAHGLSGALLVLLLGYAAGNRVLAGIGLAALAAFLSHYYYSLQETLLFKSMILAASGVLMLLLRHLLQGWLGPARESGDEN